MNRDQYFDRHRNLSIEREMLERKWRAFQEEQQLQEQMMMFEAARAAQSAAAVASGGGAGGFGWIGSALNKLNLRYSEVTALVPNIYLFWDEDSDGYFNGIDDGGDDMYDDGNFMNTNLTQLWENIVENDQNEELCIPYTHTQAENESDLPDQYTNPPMDGKVKDGTNYFGEGSKYFTNMYPGLFIMIADNVSVSEFTISGNVGSDGDGVGAGYINSIIPGWTLFYKTNTDLENEYDSDPSINHLILVPGSASGIIHEYDTTSAYDDHAILNISDRNRIIYALVSRLPEEDVLSESDAIQIAQKILEIVL